MNCRYCKSNAMDNVGTSGCRVWYLCRVCGGYFAYILKRKAR